MAHPYRYLKSVQDADVITIGESIPGSGNVWSDVNAYCFTGAFSDGACRMCIAPNAIAYVGHGSIVYRYFGPTEVCIGSGGEGGKYPHYTTVEEDWVPTGTTTHTALSDRYTANQHRIDNITDLRDYLNTIDAELARLEQDKLDIADAVAVFTFSAYFNMSVPTGTPFADLDATWQDLDILSSTFAPRGFVDEGNSKFSFQYPGVYLLAFAGTFEHDVLINTGRTTGLRLHDYTNGADIGEVVIGAGRNAEASSTSAVPLTNITEADVGHVFGVQMGGGDAFSAVEFFSLSLSIISAGVWQLPLGGMTP